MTGASPPELTLRLPDGTSETVAPGANLALIGPGAQTVIAEAVLAAAESAIGPALLLADAEDPLHGGLTVAAQIADALDGTRRAAVDRATDLLELTGIPEPHLRVQARPHQLSPLDRQRAQLALALANQPPLVVAQDPCAGLEGAAAATLAATLYRLWSRGRFTLLLACSEPSVAERACEQILLLGDGGDVVERRRRRSAHSSST